MYEGFGVHTADLKRLKDDSPFSYFLAGLSFFAHFSKRHEFTVDLLKLEFQGQVGVFTSFLVSS